MKKKQPAKKTSSTKKGGVGAHGSKTRPRGADEGPKWPGGGKKGENE